MRLRKHSTGTEYHYHDDFSRMVPNQPRYLYHFVNKGSNKYHKGYICDWGLEEAVVAAPSCDEAIELLHSELGNHLETHYGIDVYLIGIDLMDDTGNRIVTKFIKPDFG